MVEITRIISSDEIISHWNDLLIIPLVDITHAQLMAGCLTGGYSMYSGQINDEEVGIAVCLFQEKTCYILAVSSVGNVPAFRDKFYDLCIEAGYERVRMLSSVKINVYERLTKTKCICSVFEREL